MSLPSGIINGGMCDVVGIDSALNSYDGSRCTQSFVIMGVT